MEDVCSKDIGFSALHNTSCLNCAFQEFGSSILSSSQSSASDTAITKRSICEIKTNLLHKHIEPELSKNRFQTLNESVTQHALYILIVVHIDTTQSPSREPDRYISEVRI